MARVLVIGASGQLGQELRRAAVPGGWTMLFADRDELDLTDPSAAARALAAIAPDAVINAAAYTAVDKAEAEPKLAFAVNCTGAAAVAGQAAALGAPFLQLSTDYVFAGDKPEPYVETDAKAPLGAYARSKAAGEDAVLVAHPAATIVRTSWLFSPFGANFVKTMLRLGDSRDEIGVVADQFGRPTAADDLAQACVAIIERRLAGDGAAAGIFHYAGAGNTAWADFAEAIFNEATRHGRRPVHINRIATADYPTAARRPANSRLDTGKIESVLGIRPRPWRQSLGRCLDELLGT